MTIGDVIGEVCRPTDAVREEIEKLKRIAKESFEASSEAMARAYETEARIDRLRGDVFSAEFHEALARCYREPGDEATAAMDRAYIRIQAFRCMDGNFSGVPEKDLAAVTAEVERMKAEKAATP